MQNRKLTVIAAMLSISAITAQGGGFQLYNEGSAEALAQASAITARDDLVSLAWYNPAALAGAEQQSVMAGSSVILLDGEFNGTFFTESLEKHWRTIPHAYYIQPIDDTKTIALALNSPYGLVTEWPSDGNLRNLSEKAELVSIYATPSLALKLNKKLSVSAGLNAVYADAKLTSLATSTAFGGRDPNIPGQEKRVLSADDFGLGAAAGILWSIDKDWALGARYQSEVSLTLKGEAEYETSPEVKAEADLTLPDSLTIGLTYSGFKKWKIGFDAVWTDWADFDQLVYKYPAATETVPQEWKDVWGFHFGAEYQLNEAWALRGGYIWDESPVSDEYRSPMLPGSDRQLATCGFSYTFNNWTVDTAYCYIWAKSTNQGTEIVDANPPFAGEYENTAHLLSLSVGYDF